MDEKLSKELRSAAMDAGVLSVWLLFSAVPMMMNGNSLLGTFVLVASLLNMMSAARRWNMAKGE